MAKARLDKGIPNPKVRPVLPMPWSLNLTLSIFPNREIKEQEIQNLFEEGGRLLALGHSGECLENSELSRGSSHDAGDRRRREAG